MCVMMHGCLPLDTGHFPFGSMGLHVREGALWSGTVFRSGEQGADLPWFPVWKVGMAVAA